MHANLGVIEIWPETGLYRIKPKESRQSSKETIAMSKGKNRRAREEQTLKSNDLQGLLEEIQNEGDRAVAILGAGLLDMWLARLLTAYFVDDPKQVALLLDVDQPLGSFGARIRLAYCVGLLDTRIHALLSTIRGIRNDFAHQLHGLTFNSPAIAEQCAELKQVLDFPDGFENPSRTVFVAATFSARLGLWGYITSMEEKQRRRKVPEWITLVNIGRGAGVG